jgi:predicted TIM-barrel fold metal-dependent hydrolase
MSIIDGDGHVIERGADGKALTDFLPEPYRSARISLGPFPEIDHLHNEPVQMVPGAAAGSGRRVGPLEWSRFLEEVGIEATVLYPSAGLSVGTITSPDWAIAVTRAYNDWLHDVYLETNPALNGMALLPLQDPDAAVDELRRAVEELGMRGAMLPANGLRSGLGSKEYWPVYAEAERLGCALAVHGGVGSRLGFDHIEVRPAAHALAHPFGVLISLTSMVFNGVFDHHPGLRVAFLEGGVAWFLVAWERFDRSYGTHRPYNPRGVLLQLDPGQTVAGYLSALAETGRLVIGCEGEEPDLVRGVEVLGSGAFMFSSDFPHEVSPEMCKEELAEVQAHDGLTDLQKRDILGETARRFYRLS